MQLKPGTLLQSGKYTYTIGSVLGQGGFGITYQAMMKFPIEGPLGQIESEVKVAIKEFYMKSLCNRDETTRQVSVPSEGSRELVARFRKKFIKEAKCIASLRHPAIVKVIEIFEENGTAYYVMEYIEGGSMQEWVKQKGALPESEALGYIRQVASALAYIHGQKLNHLDIKPGNILRRAHGDVVLIDFGLSKQYDENGDQTSSTPVGVSFGYAPIEQSKPGGVGQFSAPTDIYSLGATLYKFVTAQTPPDASDVVSDGISLPPTVSKPVAQAIEKAMEPRPRNRPQTIQEFLSLLQEKNDHRPATLEMEETRLIAQEMPEPFEEVKREEKEEPIWREEPVQEEEKPFFEVPVNESSLNMLSVGIAIVIVLVGMGILTLIFS